MVTPRALVGFDGLLQGLRSLREIPGGSGANCCRRRAQIAAQLVEVAPDFGVGGLIGGVEDADDLQGLLPNMIFFPSWASG